MSKARKLSQAFVRKYLYCDPIAGKLFWKPREKPTWWNKKYACKEAFGIEARGYLFGRLMNKTYPAHRIIWVWVHGTNPPIVDHIDGNPSNNSITNLRAADFVINGQNQKLFSRNTSGAAGVVWIPRKRRWRAKIGVCGSVRLLGSFENKEDAIAARKKAEVELGFNPRHGTRVVI